MGNDSLSQIIKEFEKVRRLLEHLDPEALDRLVEKLDDLVEGMVTSVLERYGSEPAKYGDEIQVTNEEFEAWMQETFDEDNIQKTMR